jgi:mono/diheme cytochrome c family protein
MSLPLRLSINRAVASAATALLAMATGARGEDVLFRREVMAVVSKSGCNLGGCHGNGGGKGGLKLSLRGQDPDLDWLALTHDQGGRRVNLIQPENSLLLLKATAALAHDGGQRFTKDSPEYAILLRWIRDGAPDSGVKAPKLVNLDVAAPARVLVEPLTEVKLRATAKFADGTEKDVTPLAVYDPSNLLVTVSHDGLVQREKAGETTILVRYLNQQVAVPLAFVPARPDFAWSNPPTNNLIDEHVFKKLRMLRMNPSDLSSDGLFIRRAYLDLLGIVPSAEAARAFVTDAAPDKRAKLIDSLLDRPEFADFWALKWADLLKIEQRQLDYDGMKVFHGWIRESIAKNKPLDQFARELIAARGSTLKNPPANWWRANRDPVTRAENTARIFLGTQLNCAQCHNHPFERWTQDDYYNWTGLFARLDYKVSDEKGKDKNDKNEFKGDQTVLIKAKASVTNVRTGEPAKPRFLGGEAPELSKDRDELLALADWLPHSPMFARMQVNRVWFHLFGRGLVDPVDDFRASNPATHPELLDALAKDFAQTGYDLRRLIRTITASRTYQLSAEPNGTNADDETNHSRAIVRRLTAEQMLDSISAVLATPLPLEDAPAGTRLAQIAEGRKHYKPLTTAVDRFSASFGKPPRLIASDCERTNETAMPQVFQLVSGPLIQQLLTRKGNVLGKLIEAGKSDAEIVDSLFWTALTRPPSAAELERCTTLLAANKDRRRATEDLAWALLNSKEFVFRQ